MITTHVFGTMLGATFDESFNDATSFDFDGKDDYAVEQAIKNSYFDMKAKGFVNVQIMAEDSQVPEDSGRPDLRYGKPYMLGSGGHPTTYVADMSFDEISAQWAA